MQSSQPYNRINCGLLEKNINNFFRDGFTKVDSFFTSNEIEECKERLDVYIDKICPNLSKEDVFFENKNDKNTLKQLQRMHLYEPWFDTLFNGKTKQLAETLLDGEVITKNLQYFNKPPKIGKATPPHQDGYYFKLTPPKALTMWLALDDVDEQNGCVRYVKGSHLRGMRNHSMTGTLGFSQGISSYGNEDDIKNEIPISAKKGDLIVHDSMTIHRADQNLSDSKNRRALGFIFYSADSEEDNVSLKKYKTELKDQQRGKI